MTTTSTVNAPRKSAMTSLRFYAKMLCLSLFLLTTLATAARAQRFYSVVFNKLPQDFQLYPRDNKNEALVPISGIIELPGYSHMGIQVYRNDQLIKYHRAAITYDNKGTGSFSASQVIKAELADYQFKVFACKTADSTRIVTREKVGSGDMYVIMGQSNSTGFFRETNTSNFCRTFGKITGNLNNDHYNPADTLWAISNSPMAANVGTMGLELQKELVKHAGVPIALINGGFHWSSAQGHAIRTANNPEDLTNAYGRMLYRLKKSGMLSRTQSFIYRQGETEMYHEGFDWEVHFAKMRENLFLDMPGLKKIYVFQMDIIYYPSIIGTKLRDYQRRLPAIYPEITSLATVGTKQFDGLHYGEEGNKQGGLELSRLVARDFYDLKDTANISSPDIKKAFYRNADKTEVVMTFDEGQELIYPEPVITPTGTRTMQDGFTLDNYGGRVQSGKAEGNRIILTLKNPNTAPLIHYLPPYANADQIPGHQYLGPYITNALGMRAFSFQDVKVYDGLETPELSAKWDNNVIKISWTAVSGATRYALYRKTEAENVWKLIANAEGNVLKYDDTNASGKLQYRIKAVNATSESGEYGFANLATEVITGTENPAHHHMTVYPNPARRAETVQVKFDGTKTGAISVIDQSGRTVKTLSVKNEKEASVSNLSTGLYIIQLQTERHSVQQKVVVTP